MLEEVARACRTRALGRFRGVCASASLIAWPLLGCSIYDDSLLSASKAGPDAAVTAGGAGAASVENAGGASSGAGAQGGVPSPPGSDEDAGAAGQGAGASAGAGTGTSGADGASGASSAGSGGTLSAGGSGVAGAVAAAGSTSTETFELIDDFEDRDAFILPLQKRNGPWYVFSDSTPSAIESPFTIALLSAPNLRAGSLAALHFTASGFTDWGAGVGANFLVVDLAGKKVAYDVSAYRGIQFYARIASGAQATLKLFVPTTYSDPDGGKCSGTVDGTRCGDHLYCQIGSLKTDWALYTCQFSALVQQGFGLAQSALDPTSVYSIQFTLSTKVLPVDIWIDDVAFIKK